MSNPSERPVSAREPRPPSAEEARPLAYGPLMGGVAACFALADLFLRRGWLDAVMSGVSRADLGDAKRLGRILLIGSALAAALAALEGAYAILRSPEYDPDTRPRGVIRMVELQLRGTTTLFLIFVVATTFVAAAGPLPRQGATLVLFAVGAQRMLTLQLGLSAVRWRKARGVRAASALAALSAFASFLALIAHHAAERGALRARAVSEAGAIVGEAAYLLVPVAAVFTIFPRRGEPRGAFAIGLGVSSALSTIVCFDVWRNYLGPEYDVALYGALRLSALPSEWGLLYALPFGTAVGIGLGGLASVRPCDRQIGAACLLWLAAGYAPQSPATLVLGAAACVLFLRATAALGGVARPLSVLYGPMSQAESDAAR